MDKKNDQDVIEDLPEEDEDDIDWKALAQKNQGIAKRNQTKLKKLKLKVEEDKKAKPEVKKSESKNKEESFDYAEKSYLLTNDVKKTEFSLVRKIMDSTGKTLDEVLESKYFRAEQKELREAKESADAVPTGTKRASQSHKDKVDHWLAKGELPPADQPKLRREYVNAKAKAETNGSRFADRSVIQ